MGEPQKHVLGGATLNRGLEAEAQGQGLGIIFLECSSCDRVATGEPERDEPERELAFYTLP